MVAISPANEITVVKSPTDRRRYRFIELTNGLCALLVSDRKVRKGERKAAAAMCVGLGSFADPKEAQGLSHFLEHVLFLGSTDFPEENEFNSYLSEHGGYTNACTEMERASFYFDVDGEFLYDALRRWVPFFISPLMNQEAMQREICSVDSEFHNILWDDFERLQQLQCHTSTPGHPFNRFSWGNKKSLTDAVNFNSLRDSLKKLYNDYFHGELMKLVVIGGERLDILESWVLELFGSIKRGPLVKAQTSSDGPIWKDGKLYKLEAVADVHILVLSWTLPSLWKHYLNKVEAYIAYLLGHEGEGSVFHLLTTKGWASSLHAGVLNDGMHRSSIAYVFCMTIHLTNSGVKKIFEVIDVVYQYLKQLSLQQWIFDELCNSGKLEFMLAEKQAHLDYAKDLAEKLHLYPPQHVIYGAYAYETWDKEMINHILSFFHPKNMRVDLQTHCFEDSLGFESKRKRNIKTEPWFGSRYIEVDIPHDWIKSWQHPLKIHPSLGLPEENIFIAHDVTRRATMKVNKKVCEMEKKCALNEPMITLVQT